MDTWNAVSQTGSLFPRHARCRRREEVHLTITAGALVRRLARAQGCVVILHHAQFLALLLHSHAHELLAVFSFSPGLTSAPVQRSLHSTTPCCREDPRQIEQQLLSMPRLDPAGVLPVIYNT